MKIFFVATAVVAIPLFSATHVRAEEAHWADSVDFSGDFRLRYESIDEEFETDRNRMRFRARFGITTQVSDKVKFVTRLATGGDNPTSTNQTFDDGFSSKDIGVDLAYVDWQISDELNLYGGKMTNPLFKAGSTQLVWDSDLTPEGIAVKYSSGRVFGTVGGFSVEERSSADDSLLYVAQGGLKIPLGESNKLIVGAGYYAYTNTVGNAAFYNGDAKGNTLDAEDLYVFEYKETELFAQFDMRIRDWPLQLHAVYVRNNDADRQDAGFAYGAKVGSSKDKGQMQFAWTYLDVEADSVIATYNDSDFGAGGTDAKGHVLKAKYGLSKKLFVGGTILVNKMDRFQGVEHDYNRIQLDIEFKFD